jgi:ectoine hydroxylase-related dioxygenase (phytanoyl-CoA dioxygenase family)
MLTEAQIAKYHEDGYVIPDFQLGDAEIEEIRDRHAKLVARDSSYRDYCSHILDEDRGFLAHCQNQVILNMVSQVIGEDIALWNSSFFAKPPVNGKRTPWHQDGEYWCVRPLATCTVWLAVDDATRENGCLRIIRGSHKDKRLRAHDTSQATDITLNQELKKEEYDEKDAVDLILKKGQISLHDVYLVHGSEANNSDKPRRGMTMRFMPTTSVFDREVAQKLHVDKGITDHSERSVFLMRGVDRSGRNLFANSSDGQTIAAE